MNCLHLPIDFELREEVRRLALRLAGRHLDSSTRGSESRTLATSVFVRVWADWGRAQCDWRPLTRPFRGAEHPWVEEELTAILEEYCGWEYERGGLMTLLLESGVMRATARGDVYGLELHPDFWKLNGHLATDYVSPSQKGGIMKAHKRAQQEIAVVAKQQQALLQDQLVFTEATTPEEQARAISLVMRIDRACGNTSVRATSQYTSELLRAALGIVRKVDAESITRVEKYLHAKRNDPGVVKVPDRVIENFHEYCTRS